MSVDRAERRGQLRQQTRTASGPRSDVSSGTLLRSSYSDTLGFCFDHSKYRYDSNGDGQVTSADLTLPACRISSTWRG